MKHGDRSGPQGMSKSYDGINRRIMDLLREGESSIDQTPVRLGIPPQIAGQAADPPVLAHITRWKRRDTASGGNWFQYSVEAINYDRNGVLSAVPGGFDSHGPVIVPQPATDAAGAIVVDPTPGAVLELDESSNATFRWSDATPKDFGGGSEDPTGYRVRIGTGEVDPADRDLYDGSELEVGTTHLSVNLADIAESDATVYVRLASIYPGGEVENVFTFAGPATYTHLLVNPKEMAANPVGFPQPNSIDERYFPSNSDLILQPVGGGYPWPVPHGEPASDYGLPNNRVPIDMVLRTDGEGVSRREFREPIDHDGNCGIAAPHPAENQSYAIMVSPQNGATLSGTSVSIQIAEGTREGAIGYRIDVGSAAGGIEYNGPGGGVEQSELVADFTDLPDDGRGLVVSVWTKYASLPAWFVNYYSLTAVTG